MTYLEMIDHLENSCSKNRFVCPFFCNKNIELAKNDMIEHLKNDCPNIQVDCELCGKEKISERSLFEKNHNM